MSTDINGQICYGILFEEDFEFPWNEAQFGNDVEDWWRCVNNYKNPNPEPIDSKGNYLPSGSPEVEKYFNYLREWEKENQIPVSLVNCCHCDEPIIILAVKRTELTAYRADPKSFDPSSLIVSDEEIRELLEFCEKYIGAIPDNPKWWLSSYWG